MIRETTPEDYPRFLDVQINCINGLSAYTVNERRAWTNYIKQEGAERYAKYKNFTYQTDGRIVGFVSWVHDDQGATIECLYVLEKFRGQNIGRALLQRAEAELPAGIRLCVRSTINAEKFYEKNGYRRTGKATSRAGFDIILLEKNL